ncbi:MAG: hypothetical protein ACLP1Y_00530 [Candidatus Acidiferrales bacterium]
MRSKVDFPEPFGPINATASPGAISNDIPARAQTVKRANGCASADQPARAGGKYFSSASTKTALSATMSPYIEVRRRRQAAATRAAEIVRAKR